MTCRSSASSRPRLAAGRCPVPSHSLPQTATALVGAGMLRAAGWYSGVEAIILRLSEVQTLIYFFFLPFLFSWSFSGKSFFFFSLPYVLSAGFCRNLEIQPGAELSLWQCLVL